MDAGLFVLNDIQGQEGEGDKTCSFCDFIILITRPLRLRLNLES